MRPPAVMFLTGAAARKIDLATLYSIIIRLNRGAGARRARVILELLLNSANNSFFSLDWSRRRSYVEHKNAVGFRIFFARPDIGFLIALLGQD